MKNVVIIACLLFGAFLVAVLCGADQAFAGRVGISAVFFFTALGHFAKPEVMMHVLPAGVPWARARFHSNRVTLLANILVAVVFFIMATIREPMHFMVAAGFAGTAWTMAASELWVAGQRAMPSWARGRMNATIIMVAQGAMALGAVVWGSSVSMWGVKWTLLIACILQLGTLLLQLWLSIDFTAKLDFEPAPVACLPTNSFTFRRRMTARRGNQMVTLHCKQRDAVFRAIADPTRREILSLLRGGRQTVGEIAGNFRMSRPAISKHLRLLHSAGLVVTRQDGTARLCGLNAKPLRAINDWLRDYQTFWSETMQNLKSYVEESQ